MPVPPPPKTFVCKECRWEKTVIPKSDALVIGRDWLIRCEECGSERLEMRDVTGGELLKARLLRRLKSFGR
jgi:Zn finger protein HypA/HybF involved in hydrogenase expression